MKEHSKSSEESKTPVAALAGPELTVGMDLGNRVSHYCVVNGAGQVVERGRVRTRAEELQEWLAGKKSIGLTAGASAPEVLVEAVIRKLKEWGAEQVKEAGALIKREMEGVHKNEIPLVVEVSDGPNWAELKKI